MERLLTEKQKRLMEERESCFHKIDELDKELSALYESIRSVGRAPTEEDLKRERFIMNYKRACHEEAKGLGETLGTYEIINDCLATFYEQIKQLIKPTDQTEETLNQTF